MSVATEGQVADSAARVYQEFFVPALFGEWGPRVAEAAGIAPGDWVLDVACGTGVLARAAREMAGPTGTVTGLDRNPGMLAIARETAGIEWVEGRAESLPFPDASFEKVVSQFGLMFYEDRVGALREMARVAKPGGRIAVAVWGAVDGTPGYAALVDLLRRLFDETRAEALTAPFCLGDPQALAALFAKAGIGDVHIEKRDGQARFSSIHAWIETDVKGWTLGQLIDDAEYARLQEEAKRELAAFAASDGTVAFPHPALIAIAQC